MRGECHPNPLGLIPNSNALIETGVLELDEVPTSKNKASLVFSHQPVLAFVVALPLDISILVDHVVEGVNRHGAAEPNQYVANHFIYLHPPLYRCNALSVDWIENVEMQEVKLFFLLVEGGLDEGGVGEDKVLVERCVQLDIHLQGFSR